jgi:hypothetical protein
LIYLQYSYLLYKQESKKKVPNIHSPSRILPRKKVLPNKNTNHTPQSYFGGGTASAAGMLPMTPPRITAAGILLFAFAARAVYAARVSFPVVALESVSQK